MERFFYIVGGFPSRVDLDDLILTRYNAPEYVYNLPFVDFTALVKKALENQTEERLRAQWGQMLPFMSMGFLKYERFEDYKARCTGANIDKRPAADIIAELEELHGTKLI